MTEKKYDLFYKVKDKVVEKHRVTKDEVDMFLLELKAEDSSELRVKEIKEKEGDER